MALRDITIGPSSNIASISYDDSSGDLYVTFLKGSGVYRGVTVEEAEAISAAPSPGKHLNLFIKNSHLYEPL